MCVCAGGGVLPGTGAREWLTPPQQRCVVPQAHPKVARNYFGFIDCVCRSYIKAIVSLEPTVFLGVVKSIQEGLDSIGA